MADDPVLRVITQRGDNDCAIVVLAMYLGCTYEDVLGVAAQLDSKIHKRGMWIRQMEAVAYALNIPLKRTRRWDIDTSSGILALNRTGNLAHVVVLRAGLIFDTDGTVWEPDVFFAVSKYKPTILLERRD